MQTQQTITLFGTVSNSASSRISRNGRKYTAFGVAIISQTATNRPFTTTSNPALEIGRSRHSRVFASITVRMRTIRPVANPAATKSIAHT
jgi:hypothetical protein